MDEQSTGDDLALRGAGGAFAVMLGLAVGGPVGALSAAAFTPAGERLMQLVADEWRQNGQLVADAAQAAAGVGHEALLLAIADDPALRPLARQILEAAARTGDGDKLRALGCVLGQCVEGGPVRVDEGAVIVAALRDLEAPHLRVLHQLGGRPPQKPDQEHWSLEWVELATPELTGVLVAACIGALERHGLIDRVSTYGGFTWRINDFGRAMLDVLGRPGG